MCDRSLWFPLCRDIRWCVKHDVNMNEKDTPASQSTRFHFVSFAFLFLIVAYFQLTAFLMHAHTHTQSHIVYKIFKFVYTFCFAYLLVYSTQLVPDINTASKEQTAQSNGHNCYDRCAQGNCWNFDDGVGVYYMQRRALWAWSVLSAAVDVNTNTAAPKTDWSRARRSNR